MTHSKRQIQSWKGETAHEYMEIAQISDSELI